MPTTIRSLTVSFAWLILAAAAALASSGCARWDWRGKGYRDESTGWTQQLRPPADAKQFTGLDARAQEIERNLGVR